MTIEIKIFPSILLRACDVCFVVMWVLLTLETTNPIRCQWFTDQSQH